MKKYSTILFDFDGTIANSETALLDSVKEAVTHHGCDYEKNKKVFMVRAGQPMGEIYIELFGKEVGLRIRQTQLDVQHKHFHKYTLLDGALDTLRLLKKHQISTAIVTSANTKKIEALLTTLKISDYFDHLITIDDVKEAKPHPEGILKAMSSLHAKPDSSLMVGDSEADIKAATNAGIDSVLLLNDLVHLHDISPTYTIQQFDQLLSILGLE
jgi:pyrophosphatase PpaX